MSKIRLYAAYGSNMHMAHMKVRCPTAVVFGKGTLENYELLFRGSCPGKAYATIEPKQGATVPVVVWELQPSDEAALDQYESFPLYYRKETVKISMCQKSDVEAMVYIMNDGMPLNLPSRHHYSIIKDGYAAAGISDDVLQAALQRTKDKDIESVVEAHEETEDITVTDETE
jgi:gamma-glutamylcyclotransferase (GGCT)/AIG2-like uncharacterized protein YtfP